MFSKNFQLMLLSEKKNCFLKKKCFLTYYDASIFSESLSELNKASQAFFILRKDKLLGLQ